MLGESGLEAVAHLSELQQDPLIRSHLSVLYDTLLEQNLVRVIEPYSSVQLTWIAQEVGQDVQVVEEKLSQMILDQVFYGVLNENEGTLEIHDQPTEDVSWPFSPASDRISRSGHVFDNVRGGEAAPAGGQAALRKGELTATHRCYQANSVGNDNGGCIDDDDIM